MDDKVREILKKVMATAVVAGEHVEKGATAAGKKAGELFESAKLNVLIADQKVDISTLYKEIGRTVHDAHTGKDTDEEKLAADLKAIDEKYEEIAKLREQLDALKNTKTCPVCGLSCAREDAFCRRCGHTFE